MTGGIYSRAGSKKPLSSSYFARSCSLSILRDPGATSRDDVIFSAPKFTLRAEEPLGTFPYQTSSRSGQMHPTDWPEKYFSGQSTRRSSQVILSPSYTKWFSSIDLVAWAMQQEDSCEEFQKKRYDEADKIANRNMGAKNRSNTLPSIFLADLLKVD